MADHMSRLLYLNDLQRSFILFSILGLALESQPLFRPFSRLEIRRIEPGIFGG